MDHDHFDALTRSVMRDGGTRRALVRFLTGTALGSLVARLGPTEATEAKPKRPKAKKTRKRSSPAERKAQGPLQAEGKGNKGKKGKGKPKPPKPNPVCDNGLPRCPDGSCVPFGQCCPGFRRCAYDGFCRKEEECCPDQKRCADDSCVSVYKCCPDERRCEDGSCVGEGECCPGERQCFGDNKCVKPGECCPAERKCANGQCLGKGDCCPGEKSCDSETCVPETECCELTVPLCGNCWEASCAQGTWACRPNPASCVCPAGGVPCPGVSDPGYGLPDGCCAADRIFPDEWYGTGNAYCRPQYDPAGYWCTMDGLPGT